MFFLHPFCFSAVVFPAPASGDDLPAAETLAPASLAVLSGLWFDRVCLNFHIGHHASGLMGGFFCQLQAERPAAAWQQGRLGVILVRLTESERSWKLEQGQASAECPWRQSTCI